MTLSEKIDKYVERCNTKGRTHLQTACKAGDDELAELETNGVTDEYRTLMNRCYDHAQRAEWWFKRGLTITHLRNWHMSSEEKISGQWIEDYVA